MTTDSKEEKGLNQANEVRDTTAKEGATVIELPLKDSACPICGKPAVQRYNPFCSKRCADIDLNRWFNGVYRIPAQENEQDEEETSHISEQAEDKEE